MSVLGSGFGHMYGMGDLIKTYERAWSWGPWPPITKGVHLDASIADTGNTPNYEIRPGLVIGRITATGAWRDYNPAHTDGSEVAGAVVIEGIRVQDLGTGANKDRLWAAFFAGGIKATNGVIGLDNLARAQLCDRMIFDDQFPSAHWFPFQRFQSKTANYQVAASDNYTEFDNLGATGEVDFTLPPIANGYYFLFRAIANQTLKVISTEGSNIVAFNNASASSLAYSTAGQIVGGGFSVWSNAAATKWIVDDTSAGANTVTVA